MSQPITPRNRANANADLQTSQEKIVSQQSQENIVSPIFKLGVPNLSLEEIQKRINAEETPREEKRRSTGSETSLDTTRVKRSSDHYVEVLFSRFYEKGPVKLSRSKSFDLENTKVSVSMSEPSPREEKGKGKEKNIPKLSLKKLEESKKKSFFSSPKKHSGEDVTPQIPRWDSSNFNSKKLPSSGFSLKKSESKINLKNPLPYLKLLPTIKHYSIKTAEKELIKYLSIAEKELIACLSKVEDLSKAEKELIERLSKNVKTIDDVAIFNEIVSKVENLSKAEKGLIERLSKNLQTNDDVAIFNEIVAILVEVRRQLLTSKQRERFRKLLIRILMWREPKGAKILVLYFREHKEELVAFAIEGLEKLQKLKSGEILSLLYQLTKIDLEFEKTGTLFRDAGLSTTLCGKYGGYLAYKELNVIAAHIVRELKKWKNPFDLCIDRDWVQSITQEKNEGLIQVQLTVNRHNFEGFAEVVLNVIYATEFNKEFLELLQMHRAAIIEFLQEKGESDPRNASRLYSGALTFLRILNPRILSIEKTSPICFVLASLTKFTQCLSKEGKFGDEKFAPDYEPLNGLVAKFNDKHEKVVDGWSLIVENKDSNLKVQEQP